MGAADRVEGRVGPCLGEIGMTDRLQASDERDPTRGKPESPARQQPAGAGNPPVPRVEGQLVHSREFVEFLAELGPLMRSSAEPPHEDRRKRRSFRLGLAAVLVLLLALARDPLWSWWSAYGPVPEELLGGWSTDSPRFADRGFVVTPDSLRLQLGADDTVGYSIVGVRRGGKADERFFTLRYYDGDQSLQMALRMERDSTVSLVNLPNVSWRKKRR